jgi:hypothetical protein
MPRAQSEDQAFPQSMIAHHQQTVDMAFFDDMVGAVGHAARRPTPRPGAPTRSMTSSTASSRYADGRLNPQPQTQITQNATVVEAAAASRQDINNL